MRESVEFGLAGRGEIERHDGRLRVAFRFNQVIDGLEFRDIAAMQYDGCAMPCEGKRGRATKALPGAGDQNHAVFQQAGGGLVIDWQREDLKRHCWRQNQSKFRKSAAPRAAAIPLRTAPSIVAGCSPAV